MKNVAVILPNYNMNERANAIQTYLEHNCEIKPEFICVRNGGTSNEFLSAGREGDYTEGITLDQNVQTVNAWLMGLHYADALERVYGGSFFAYCFMITSAEFTQESKDPITPMVEFLAKNPNAVGVHPALTDDSTTSWEHMKSPTPDHRGFRSVWMIDNICSMWRADWFNSIGRFDPRLIYAWGSDLETCYKARKGGKGIYVCDDVKVKKVTDIGYTMDRMGMSAEERKQKARKNMDEVFTDKYGPDWKDLMYGIH